MNVATITFFGDDWANHDIKTRRKAGLARRPVRW